MATFSSRFTARPKRKDISPERNLSNVPVWAHPEYQYYVTDWKIIRDCAEGAKDVSDAGEFYLPKLEGMDAAEYKIYLQQSCYYNFTGRTSGALTGSLLKKKPIIDSLPADLVSKLQNVTVSGESWDCYVERLTEEYVKMRRFGTLVDLPSGATQTPAPYICEYTAENILDWHESVVDPVTGRKALDYVVLREYKPWRSSPLEAWKLRAQYRVLRLLGAEDLYAGVGATTAAQVEALNIAYAGVSPLTAKYGFDVDAVSPNGLVYVQDLYALETADATLSSEPVRSVPSLRGVPFSYIPFTIAGKPQCTKPGLLDIARLNLSHYNSSALLEHARFYTGLPVYYVEVDDEGESEYMLAPSRVWEIKKGCKAGVIEFNGQGLKFLENALVQKEAQAASLGGRMIGVTSQSTAETDNQTKMKDRNEQAILLQNARALEESATETLRWWASFNLVSADAVVQIAVEYNKDFLYDAIGSREFRAIQALYQAGHIPVEVLYDYLKKAEVINEDMSLDQFKLYLNTKGSFPNQPDFAARKAGYANAASQTQAELKEGDQHIAQEEVDLQEKVAEDAAAAAAVQKAIVPPKAANVPGVAPRVRGQGA